MVLLTQGRNLAKNKLEGKIPENILDNRQQVLKKRAVGTIVPVSIDLSYNSLTGTIPVANLTLPFVLQQLYYWPSVSTNTHLSDLRNNRDLYGTIPKSFLNIFNTGDLPQKSFRLSGNPRVGGGCFPLDVLIPEALFTW